MYSHKNILYQRSFGYPRLSLFHIVCWPCHIIPSGTYLHINPHISNVITLTIVEAAVALTASCLATLKPLVRSFLDWSEKSMHSTGALHTRMMDGIGLGRTKLDDTELHLRPDLKIIGFTTTVISSNGRESPSIRHTSLSQPVEDKGEAWYTPHGSPNSHVRLESGNGLTEAAEPAYHIR